MRTSCPIRWGYEDVLVSDQRLRSTLLRHSQDIEGDLASNGVGQAVVGKLFLESFDEFGAETVLLRVMSRKASATSFCRPSHTTHLVESFKVVALLDPAKDGEMQWSVLLERLIHTSSAHEALRPMGEMLKASDHVSLRANGCTKSKSATHLTMPFRNSMKVPLQCRKRPHVSVTRPCSPSLSLTLTA